MILYLVGVAYVLITSAFWCYSAYVAADPKANEDEKDFLYHLILLWPVYLVMGVSVLPVVGISWVCRKIHVAVGRKLRKIFARDKEGNE